MNPDGRPKTRSLEQQMVAIYKLIHRTMVNKETTNVSKACRSVFDEVDLIKFTDPALPDHARLMDICKSPENLRKRYCRAIECASDAAAYPILHHTVTRLTETLPTEIEKHKLWRCAHESAVEDGRHIVYETNSPLQFTRKP
jgi:hypothetical protein